MSPAHSIWSAVWNPWTSFHQMLSRRGVKFVRFLLLGREEKPLPLMHPTREGGNVSSALWALGKPQGPYPTMLTELLVFCCPVEMSLFCCWRACMFLKTIKCCPCLSFSLHSCSFMCMLPLKVKKKAVFS